MALNIDSESDPRLEFEFGSENQQKVNFVTLCLLIMPNPQASNGNDSNVNIKRVFN